MYRAKQGNLTVSKLVLLVRTSGFYAGPQKFEKKKLRGLSPGANYTDRATVRNLKLTIKHKPNLVVNLYGVVTEISSVMTLDRFILCPHVRVPYSAKRHNKRFITFHSMSIASHSRRTKGIHFSQHLSTVHTAVERLSISVTATALRPSLCGWNAVV
jgi:hypothetical protein